MRVLLVNKFYFPKGGAENLFFDTAQLLRDKGHQVFFFSMEHPDNRESQQKKYFVSHVDFEDPGVFYRKIKASLRILYSFEAKKKIRKLIREIGPDIVHLHNIHHYVLRTQQLFP